MVLLSASWSEGKRSTGAAATRKNHPENVTYFEGAQHAFWKSTAIQQILVGPSRIAALKGTKVIVDMWQNAKFLAERKNNDLKDW